MKRSKTGSSLIVALIMVTVITAVGGIVYTFSSQQAFQSQKAIELLKARAIAESGLNIVYKSLAQDISLISNLSASVWSPQSFDGGTYHVYPLALANNRIMLTSVGNFHSANADARVDLRYYPTTEVVTKQATVVNNGNLYGPYTFTYVLSISGALSDWGGCGTFSGGAIYVNGPISLKGSAAWGAPSGGSLTVSSSTKVEVQGSATINANTVTAPDIDNSSKITGTKVEASVPVPNIPTIELSPFFEVAKLNGQNMTVAKFEVPDGFSPPGGVLWVDGTIDFKGSATGCFIATGGITMEAGASVHPINANWPTIYNKSGDISFTGQAETYGFVYAGGDVKFTGGGALQGGPVIIKGNLQKGGNSDMTAAIPSSGFTIMPPVVTPQQTVNTPSRLVITGWM